MATKAEAAASRVRKLWAGGERARAVALADELKVKPDNWPDGMAAYRRRTNR